MLRPNVRSISGPSFFRVYDDVIAEEEERVELASEAAAWFMAPDGSATPHPRAGEARLVRALPLDKRCRPAVAAVFLKARDEG